MRQRGWLVLGCALAAGAVLVGGICLYAWSCAHSSLAEMLPCDAVNVFTAVDANDLDYDFYLRAEMSEESFRRYATAIGAQPFEVVDLMVRQRLMHMALLGWDAPSWSKVGPWWNPSADYAKTYLQVDDHDNIRMLKWEGGVMYLVERVW